MTIEEMDAEIAHMTALNKRMHDELVADKTAQIARTKDPVLREFYIRDLEEIRAIGNGQYD